MFLDGIIYGILGWYVKNVFPSKLCFDNPLLRLKNKKKLLIKTDMAHLNRGILFLLQNSGEAQYFVDFFAARVKLLN